MRDGPAPGGDASADGAPPEDRVASAARSTLLLSPLVALAGLVGSVVVVRVLEPEDYALFALAIALRSTLQVVADLGTGMAGMRVFAELHQHGARAQAHRAYLILFGLRMVAVAVLAAVILALPDTAADVLGLRADERWFLVVVVLIGASEMTWSLAGATLNGLLAQGLVWRVNLVQALVQPVLVVAAALAGLGIEGIVGGVLATSVLKFALINGYAWRTIGRIPDSGERLDNLRGVFATVAGSSAVGKLAAYAHTRAGVTIIAIGALPRADVAVFALAYDLSHQLLAMIATPLVGVLLPAMAGRDRAEVQSLLLRSTRALALALFPVAAVLLAAWPSLVHVLFGTDYDGTVAYAAIILPLLALETVLGAPANGAMLAQDRFVRDYGRLKAVTLAVALVYLVIAQGDLLLTTAVMMGVRVLSAVAMRLVLRRGGYTMPTGWLVRLAVAMGAALVAGAMAGQFLPGQVADVVVVPLVAALVALVVVRAGRLVDEEDLDTAARVLPFSRRWLTRLEA